MAMKWRPTEYGYKSGQYQLSGDRDGFTVLRGEEPVGYGRTLDEAKAEAEKDAAVKDARAKRT